MESRDARGCERVLEGGLKRFEGREIGVLYHSWRRMCDYASRSLRRTALHLCHREVVVVRTFRRRDQLPHLHRPGLEECMVLEEEPGQIRTDQSRLSLNWRMQSQNLNRRWALEFQGTYWLYVGILNS